MLCVRYGTARHVAEEAAGVAARAANKADGAISRAAVLHGALAVAVWRRAGGVAPHPAALAALKKTMLRIQLSVTLGEGHASVATFARYKAERARLRSLRVVAPLVRELAELATDQRKWGTQFKGEVAAMKAAAEAEAAQAEAALTALSSAVSACFSA